MAQQNNINSRNGRLVQVKWYCECYEKADERCILITSTVSESSIQACLLFLM